MGNEGNGFVAKWQFSLTTSFELNHFWMSIPYVCVCARMQVNQNCKYFEDFAEWAYKT